MKVYLLHGDNEIAIKKRLDSLIQEAKKIGLDVEKIDLDTNLTLTEIAGRQGLFGESAIVIENPGRFPKKDIVAFFKIKETFSGTVIFYQSGFLTNTFLEFLPKNVNIELFKLPKFIYKFLDSIYPGNSENALLMLHRLADNQPGELIMYLLARLLRDLYLLKIDAKALTYPDWRILKLDNQAKEFSLKKLNRLIKKLSEVDVRIKTSKEDLISSLDLLIISELE